MRVKARRWSTIGEGMDGSSRDSSLRWLLLIQAALAGIALGVVSVAGSAVFLENAAGVPGTAAGVVITLIAAVAVGLWAGAPGASSAEPPVRTRWFAAGLAVGAGGIFATLSGMYSALQVGLLARVFSLLVLTAAPAYALGLLLPALLAWAEQREEADTEEAEPMHWEPLGTLVLALLVGLLLGFASSALLLLPRFGAGPVLLGTGALLIIPTLLPEPVETQPRERVLAESDSALGTLRVTEIVYPGQRQPERRLYVNEEEESGELVRSGAPTLAYIAAAEEWFAETARRGDRYLFLGGGAYTLPRRVAERDRSAQITVVELDPEVTRAAYRFFGIRRHHGILSVHGDARAYLEQAADASFDRIFVDVYGGLEILPYPLVTREAFQLMRSLLRSGGTVALNAIGVTHRRGARRLWSLVRTVEDVYPAVALYSHLGHDYPDRQNVLIVAARDGDAEFPRRAGLFDGWPREEWPAAEGTLVFRDLFPEPPAPEKERRTAIDRAAGA
jgi:hypothetical protein